MRTCLLNLILRERNMKNKLPLIIGAVVVIAVAMCFMQGGDKTAKKVVIALSL